MVKLVGGDGVAAKFVVVVVAPMVQFIVVVREEGKGEVRREWEWR